MDSSPLMNAYMFMGCLLGLTMSLLLIRGGFSVGRYAGNINNMGSKIVGAIMTLIFALGAFLCGRSLAVRRSK